MALPTEAVNEIRFRLVSDWTEPPLEWRCRVGGIGEDVEDAFLVSLEMSMERMEVPFSCIY